MRKLLIALVICSIANIAFAQKHVLPTTISDGSKFEISASAKSVTNVTFSIKIIDDVVNKDMDDLGFTKDIKVIEIKPFYESTFKNEISIFLTDVTKYIEKTEMLTKISKGDLKVADQNKLMEILGETLKVERKKDFDSLTNAIDSAKVFVVDTELDQWAKEKNDKRLKGLFDDSFLEDLKESKGYSINTNDPEYYKAKTRVNETINRLYQYFHNQIVLLFRYDNEPLAGILHYQTKIQKVQYFPSKVHPLWLNKVNKKYHRLIRLLYRQRRGRLGSKWITTNNDSVLLLERKKLALDSVKSLKDSISKEVSRNVAKLKEKLESAWELDEIEELIETQNGREPNYLKTITLDEFRESISEAYINDTTTDEEDKNERKNVFGMHQQKFVNDEYKAQEKKESITEKIFREKIIKYDKGKDENYDDKYNKFVESLVGLKKIKESGNTRNDELLLVTKYFDKDSKIFDAELLDSREFIIIFEDLINYFRVYNRNKRLQLVKDFSLKHLNKRQTDTIKELLKKRKFIRKKINSELSKIEYFGMKIEVDSLERRLERIERKLLVSEFSILKFLCKEGEDSKILKQIKEDPKCKSLDIDIDSRIKEFRSEYESSFYFGMKSDTVSECLWVSKQDQPFGTKKVKVKNKSDFCEINNSISKLDLEKKRIDKRIEDLNEILASKNNEDVEELSWDFDFGIIYSEKSRDSLISNLNDSRIDENVVVRKLKKEFEKAPLREFLAEDIELDINDGFVEHITIYAKNLGISTEDKELKKSYNDFLKDYPDELQGKSFVFKNQFPYGFSSSADYDDFKDHKLSVYHGDHKQFEVRMEEIFPNYLHKLQNDRLDFSPKDQVVRLPLPGVESGSVELKKETSSKLFNLSYYTDFLGLRGEPNGVVQFEFNKSIPIYTKRKTSLWGERYFGRGFNYGFFNYINPQLRWSRLEDSDDENNLKLSSIDIFEGNESKPKQYVTTLDLLRFENISVGADLNFISIDFPSSKWRFETNVSARFGRTRILDTGGNDIIVNDTTNIVKRSWANTWRYYPEFIFKLRPEERYGANLILRPIRYNTVTTDFSVVSSAARFEENLTDNPQWLHQIEINAHFSPSARKDNKFFFRYRYTNNANWETNGFSELQLGYSMSLKF